MIKLETAYRHGFLDGMRNCGHLVIDVEDKDLWLSDTWLEAIETGYKNRNYKDKDLYREEYYTFLRQQITEVNELTKENDILRGLLKEANERV